MNNETKQVPIGATRFNIGEFDLKDNGESAKSAPIKMVARSAKPIEHFFWGSVVHDLAGMQLHKSSVAIDYIHDSNQIIGYLNHFEVTDEGLVASGALTPFKESDKATELIHLSKMGVPLEASINFGGDGIEIEELEEGDDAEVNGQFVEGPMTIIRKWPLRGVAVCPYGADMNTSSTFAQGQQEITVNKKHKELIVKTETEETVEAKVEAEAVETIEEIAEETVEATDDVVEELEAEEVEEEVEELATALSDAQVECKRFITEFGTRGGEWFADGVTFENATIRYITELKAENETLSTKLKAVDRGEAEAIDTGRVDDESPKELTEFDKKFAALGGTDDMPEKEKTELTQRVETILKAGEELKNRK